MIIPNSIVRFDFLKYDNDSAELICTRELSWYTADADMQRLVSYLPDGDAIFMTIEDSDGKEEVRIHKNNGRVRFKYSAFGIDRIGLGDIGIPEMLFEEHSPMYYHANTPQKVDVCSIDGYIKLIADTFTADDELLPVVQQFLYEVLCVDRINSYAEGDSKGMLLEQDCEKLEKLHEVFSTVESTRDYLKQVQCAISAPDTGNLKSINAFSRTREDNTEELHTLTSAGGNVAGYEANCVDRLLMSNCVTAINKLGCSGCEGDVLELERKVLSDDFRQKIICAKIPMPSNVSEAEDMHHIVKCYRLWQLFDKVGGDNIALTEIFTGCTEEEASSFVRYAEALFPLVCDAMYYSTVIPFEKLNAMSVDWDNDHYSELAAITMYLCALFSILDTRTEYALPLVSYVTREKFDKTFSEEEIVTMVMQARTYCHSPLDCSVKDYLHEKLGNVPKSETLKSSQENKKSLWRGVNKIQRR